MKGGFYKAEEKKVWYSQLQSQWVIGPKMLKGQYNELTF